MFLFGLFPNTDILIDVVNFSFIVIVPALIYSWTKARNSEYNFHKKIQLTLFAVLFVAVILFEVDLRMRGGIFEMVKDSQFAETLLLNGLIWFHLFVSITTTLIWIGLIIFSLRKFAKPPVPNDFSEKHKFWGKLGMIDMILTGITGVMLYVLGFAMTK
jgi:putative membrane protein